MSLSIGGALLVGFFGIMLGTQPGRSWLENQGRQALERLFSVRITYDGLDAKRLVDGYSLELRQLQIRSEDKDEAPLSVAKLELRFARLPVGTDLHQAFQATIEGLRLEAVLRPSGFSIPALHRQWTIEELARILQSDQPPLLPKFSLQWIDGAATLDYGDDSASEVWQLSSSGYRAQDGSLSNLRLSAGSVDIARLIALTREVVPKPLANIRGGRLSELQLECQDLARCTASGQLAGLHWQGSRWIPTLRSLDLNLRLIERILTIEIPKQNISILYPYVSKEQLSAEIGATDLKLEMHDEALRISLPNSLIRFRGLATRAKLQLEVPIREPGRTSLFVESQGQGADLIQVFAWLPEELIGAPVKSWLQQHFHQGKVGDFLVKVSGKLPATPLVEVRAGFSETRLDFAPNWPRLSQCSGEFQMRGLEMIIPVTSCRSEAVRAEQGSVRIAGIAEERAKLEVEARASSSVGDAFRYLAKSQLKGLGEAFLAAGVEGVRQQTDLHIAVPLGDSPGEAISVRGESQLTRLSFDLKGGIYKGTSPALKLHFDEKGLMDLSGLVIGPHDRTRVEISRDERSDSLKGSLTPETSDAGALQGRFRILPSASPDLVTAQLQGYKPEGAQSSVNFESLRWQLGKTQSLAMKGEAKVGDFGQLSQILGLGKKFSKGKGQLNFDLALADLSSDIGAKAINGQLLVDLKDGRIEDLPRAAVSLVRFANLDALGIKSSAMPYEYLKGDINFANGQMAIRSSEIGLGIVEGRMDGSIDYLARRLNLNMTIIPDLGAPMAAVAIGFWNPIVGLGLFGYSQFQKKTSDSILNRIVSQTYKIEGPMDDSEIHLIRPLNVKSAFE